jgi:uncharacterized protein YbjQ (UPF0145 family)
MGVFASGLSVPAGLVVEQGGFRPLGPVLGTCTFRLARTRGPQVLSPSESRARRPWQAGPTRSWWAFRYGAQTPLLIVREADGDTLELEAPTEGLNTARTRALERLSEDAGRVGGDAVVGVRLRRRHPHRLAGVVEYTAIGTAVRSERYDLGEAPTLSNLSGQEFATLLAHGAFPVGLVAGSTVAYAVTGLDQARRISRVDTRWSNQELPDFSRAISGARALAMRRMEREAHAVHAHGIVGVTFDRVQYEVEREGATDLIVEANVLGTAVVELDGADPPAVYTALRLS